MSDLRQTGQGEPQPQTEAEPGTAIATVNDWDGRSRAIRTSLALDSAASVGTLVAALNGKDGDLQDLPGKPFVVRDYVLHARELTDEETGEIRIGLRLVLIGPKGERYAGASRAVIEAWALIASTLWPLRHGNDVEIVLKRNPRKGGTGNYLTIDTVRCVKPTK